jgi:hypothetical protein
VRYIGGTTDLCLTLDAEAGKRIILGYADADWRDRLETRRSTTGDLFKTFGGLGAWKGRRQPTVALSTAEAEIMAMNYTSHALIDHVTKRPDLSRPLGLVSCYVILTCLSDYALSDV